MMKHIGVIIELEQGKIKKTNFGMITLARVPDAQVFAFVINADGAFLKADLEAFGITKIVDVCIARDQQDNPVVVAQAMIMAIQTYHIDVVFGLSTAKGKDLLPRIAALICAPLVMDCFDVDLEQNLVKTSQYSGKTIATVKLKGPVLIVGVRPRAVEPIKSMGQAEQLKLDGTGFVSRGFAVMKAGRADTDTPISLSEAEVIIAGGRGMKNSENFTFLSRCAKKLNAAVGSSRAAVDLGWVPYSMQVGQTGEKVNPRVYLACGISGSVQHFAGMRTSGMVIAINTDETAPIMSNNDYYVKADAVDIMSRLAVVLEKTIN